MSANTATSLTAKLRESTVEILWRQWRAIGGAAAGAPVTAQVDLEVLCLASLALEHHEPRLATTLADWLRLGSTLVSVQRVKNLSFEFPNGTEYAQRLAQLAGDVSSDARWRPLADAGKRKRRGRPLGVKERSAGPTLLAPPALSLRLRTAFGVGVKADLIAFLLGQRYRVTVSAAAAALAYTTPSVFRAMQDLQAAGLIRAADLPAAAEYWMDAPPWAGLLGGPEKIAYWGYWRELMTYACAVVRWDEETRRRTLSDYARGAFLRDLAATHQADLLRSGALGGDAVLPQSPALEDWRVFHERLSAYIEREGE